MKPRIGDTVQFKKSDITGTVEKILRGTYVVKTPTSKLTAWPEDLIIVGLSEVSLEKEMDEHQKNVDEIMAIQGIEPIEAEMEEVWHCPEGYIFKDENGNVINAQKIVLEKKKKEYTKGAKVRHKTKGVVETVVGLCKIKYMGAWVDGVIYEGNDTNTGEPMTFVRLKEDFENNFELCGSKEIVMNKYRVVEAKDRYGYAWYFPQRLSCEGTWEDISQGWINQEAAMERIRRDITHKVVWEGSEEEVLRPMQEWQKEHENG